MVDSNKTDITVVLDRSGSMVSICAAMRGGFNRFIKDQALRPGECVVSLYQFDTAYESVYVAKPAGLVPPLELIPRGSTALLDAVGQTIIATGERLGALPEHLRPGVVVLLIITDGQENASTEHTYEGVRALIKQQQEVYNWKVVYLGSDLSTVREAGRLGTSNVMSYAATSRGVGQMYNVVSSSVGGLRSAVASGDANAELNLNSESSPK